LEVASKVEAKDIWWKGKTKDGDNRAVAP